MENADDAGVYRISDDSAIVNTLDFFPPIVDDPYEFGQIAAANALSDVYAMGGTPRLAMNIVCFPRELDVSILSEILKGSIDKIHEAGALLVGGHSIEDSEVKYGLSVTGFIDPKNIKANSGAKAGDILMLTKPIGVGVITSAIKAGKLEYSEAHEALASMKALNRAASLLMVEYEANACTDVTGFGLIGHAMEMAKASEVSLIIRAADVKIFRGALELVKKRSCRPRSIASVRQYLSNEVVCKGIGEPLELLMYDPQTSGGLLISIPEERAALLLKRLGDEGINASVIGHAVDREDGWRIRLE